MLDAVNICRKSRTFCLLPTQESSAFSQVSVAFATQEMAGKRSAEALILAFAEVEISH